MLLQRAMADRIALTPGVAMIRVSIISLAVCALFLTTACGDDDPGGPSGGGTNPRLTVSYTGFVGASFSASAPTFCPTTACAVTAPQTVTAPGTYTYSVAEGATYVLQGTLIGRQAPLSAPNFNVGSALAFSLGWEPAPVSRLFGIRESAVKVFVNDIEIPTDVALNGPGCGHYMETLITPGTTTRFRFIFSVISYILPPPDLCS